MCFFTTDFINMLIFGRNRKVNDILLDWYFSSFILSLSTFTTERWFSTIEDGFLADNMIIYIKKRNRWNFSSNSIIGGSWIWRNEGQSWIGKQKALAI